MTFEGSANTNTGTGQGVSCRGQASPIGYLLHEIGAYQCYLQLAASFPAH